MKENIERLIRDLTLEEKARLTSGSDNWHSGSVDRLGIPALKLSDGPNGVRGETRDTHPVTSASFPVGTALAATWNPELIRKVGKALAQEARSKDVHILLGPTVNTHRTPLAGRNFECFSEDPFLSTRITVAYIQGIQSEGVAACVKHFTCNDQEFERFTISAEVPLRALHEIYLPAFKAAVIEAGVYTLMSAYNKVNGTFASENHNLLMNTLKGDWGFDGLVISDWYGTYSKNAAFGGCDLEMPGPARWMGEKLISGNEVLNEELLNDQVRRLLRTMYRTKAFKSSNGMERSEDKLEHRELIRDTGTEAIVLLKNEDEILPLNPSRTNKIALIGQLADQVSFQGGGSSQVAPHYLVSPLEALNDRYQGEVHYAQGYDIRKHSPPLDKTWLVREKPETELLSVQYFNNTSLSGDPVHQANCEVTHLSWFGETAKYWDPNQFSLRLEGKFVPPATKEYTFTLTLVGRGRLLIDNEVVLDLWDQSAAEQQLDTNINLDASRTYSITIEYVSELDLRWRMVRLGVLPSQTPNFLQEAIDLAAECDAALIIAGLSPDWESEGFDRDSLQLPGGQNELIQKVAQVNPNTIVILNSGSPVLMPWIDMVPGILQMWYLGQESGNALVDILLGNKNPSGKLPTTFPRRIEDTPTYANYPGKNGAVHYREGIFVGYRHYDKQNIDPLFPFGHGLSYTTFEYSDLYLSKTEISPGENITLSFILKNTGLEAGNEVVQIYIRKEGSSVDHPDKELKSFQKIRMEADEISRIDIDLESNNPGIL